MTFVLRRNVSVSYYESGKCVFVLQGVLCKPLLLAARGGHKEIVEYLLEKGASPTEEDTVKLKHYHFTKKITSFCSGYSRVAENPQALPVIERCSENLHIDTNTTRKFSEDMMIPKTAEDWSKTLKDFLTRSEGLPTSF